MSGHNATAAALFAARVAADPDLLAGLERAAASVRAFCGSDEFRVLTLQVKAQADQQAAKWAALTESNRLADLFGW